MDGKVVPLSVFGLVAIGAAVLVLSQPRDDTAAEAEGIAQPTRRPAAPSLTIPRDRIEAARDMLHSERQVRDFIYDPSAVVQWTIGMNNDGSDRSGFAEYVCLRLRELGASNDLTEVRVVDYAKYQRLKGDARSSSMGHVACSTGQHISP